MPVSKKRVKKSQKRKSYGPPPSKSEIVNKKKPLSRQQIAIYVVSTLIILSMAIGFIISGLGGGATATQNSGDSDVNIEELLATPAPDDAAQDEDSNEAGEGHSDNMAEDSSKSSTEDKTSSE